MSQDATPQQQRLVRAAGGITILLGLIFVFVRAPHPFGWEGIDHYYDLALRLARGEPFPTTDVPWGYAYFLAFFYRLAGNHQWVPLVAQVLLNGLVPWLLYRVVRESLGTRTAVTAALLVSLLSFNTVYASTQSSDSVCTVLFTAGLAAFAVALRADDLRLFALSGLLAGLAAQFRPNLILFPGVLALVCVVMTPRSRRRVRELAVYVALAGAVSVPWIVRNYRLTGEIIPTSTHGGVQLWYGSLQTGSHLDSWAHNPRALFEAAPFDYSSLPERALVVSASAQCGDAKPVDLLFWTDRDTRPQVASRAAAPDAQTVAFTLPAQPNRTAVYYYLSAPRPDGAVTFTPAGGPADPFVFFVDDRHIEDLDRHGDVLDVFDLIRVLREIGFGERAADRRLDLTGDGAIDARDLERIVRELLADEFNVPPDVPIVAGVTTNAEAVTARFSDGSTFAVPRRWSGVFTDIAATPGIAGRLCYTRRRMRSLGAVAHGDVDICRTFERVRVNDLFYLREPHTMRRYTALAWDNIRRTPGAFAVAAAYRAVRLFVIQGTSDADTNWQFTGGRGIYALAWAASLAYVLLAAAGVIVALRRRQRVWLLLTPIVYIPATISVVLTNMRYTITVQPLILAFVAVAVVAAWDIRSTRATSTPRSPDTPA